MQIFLITCAVIALLALGTVVATAWINVRSWRQVRNAARRRRLEFHPQCRG